MSSLASSLARQFVIAGKNKKRKGALVFALTGDLGTGKTAFAKGFLRALGVRQKITSPTFVLMKRYALSAGRAAYHVDCYRLKNARELSVLGFRKILENKSAVVLVEWADKIKKVIPPDAVRLEFFHGAKETAEEMAKETERTVKITAGRFPSAGKRAVK